MNHDIVLATGNAGKVREMAEHLASLGYRVRPQSDFNLVEAEETGLSFVENALIKARHAAQCTGLPAIADDSGLEVDALRGAPGIHSARYAGAAANDAANNQKLLDALREVPAEQRTARFHCVLVHLRHAADPMPTIAYGTWQGSILFEPRGTHGFGYDPLFLDPATGLSAAELPPATKQRCSHRAQALARLQQLLGQR